MPLMAVAPVAHVMTPALVSKYADVSLKDLEHKAIKKYGIRAAGEWYTWDCKVNNPSTGTCTFVMVFVTGAGCGGKITVKDVGSGISYKFRKVVCT